MPGKGNPRISVRLQPGTMRLMKARAEAEGVTISALVQRYSQEGLERAIRVIPQAGPDPAAHGFLAPEAPASKSLAGAHAPSPSLGRFAEHMMGDPRVGRERVG